MRRKRQKRKRGHESGYVPTYFLMSSAVLACPHLNPTVKVVYGALETFADCKIIRPSIATLGRRSGLRAGAVKRALRKLEERGLIVIQHRAGWRGINYYTICKEQAQFGCDQCSPPTQEEPAEIEEDLPEALD